MKYRIATLMLTVGTVVAAGSAVALGELSPDSFTVYQQHEQAAHLEDLPEADRSAASSSVIDAEGFATHLPLISIETGGQIMPGMFIPKGYMDDDGTLSAKGAVRYNIPEDVLMAGDGKTTLADDGRETIPATFSLRYSEGSANTLSDQPAVSGQVEVRYRGHSSRFFDKKSYKIEFTQADRLTSVDKDLLGMGAEDDWVLYGPYLDKTLVRNYMTLALASEFMPNVPETRFCELFVDGEYRGVYLLMETVEYGDNRIRMTKSDPKSDATSYIVERDWMNWHPEGSTEPFSDFLYAIGAVPADTEMTIRYPSEATLTQGQKDWIEHDLDAIEKALYSRDYDSTSWGYRRLLDVQSFVDYAVLNEFAINSDAGTYSTYYYKDARGKLTVGPVWDFNNAYDNYTDESFEGAGFIMYDRAMFSMLYKDDRFTEMVIERYNKLRQTTLSNEHVNQVIDQTLDYLGPAIERNYQVWGYSFDPAPLNQDNKLSPDWRNPKDFQEALTQLKEAIALRADWLDRNIANIRQFSHESAVKAYDR